MGQYYAPINLDKKESLYSHVFNNGLKLMEHSYINNYFTEHVTLLLSDQWLNQVVVWCGDYADNSENEFLSDTITDISKSLDLEYDTDFENWSDWNTFITDFKKDKVLVNFDKKEFCQFDSCPIDKFNLQIHPLPLLTCNSNGRGGGDYYGESSKSLVGSWAYDKIGVITKKEIPTNFKEIKPRFSEYNRTQFNF